MADASRSFPSGLLLDPAAKGKVEVSHEVNGKAEALGAERHDAERVEESG